MTTTIRAYKGLVTKRNDVALNWLQESAQLFQRIEQGGVGAQRERAREITMDITTCEEYIDLLEASVTKLTKAFDGLQDATDEEEDQLDKYVENAQGTIMKLHAHRSQLRKWQTDITGGTHRAETDPASSVAVSKLPVIPIPTFTGKKWEWDNFWALFKANVHDQELTELQKFNYLLSSLSGEAKQSISRFFVSANNYEKAIQHLAKRYGDKNGIVRQLNRNLKSCSARGPSTLEQRQLWDNLAAIANQLEEHEQHLDNELTIDTFLEKFHVRIRREAMDKQLRSEERNKQEWTLKQWLDAIDEVISREEQLNERLSAELQQIRTPAPTNARKGNLCECCRSKGHRWTTCPHIPTATQKKNFLLESNRCLNCGSNNHRVASCFSGNCRNCNKKHHTAICSEKSPSEMTPGRPPIRQQEKPDAAITSRNQPKTPAKPYCSSKQHVVTKSIGQETKDITREATENPEEENPSVLLLRGKLHTDNLSNSFLDNEAMKKTLAPTGIPIVIELERQADLVAPASSPLSDNMRPPAKRSPVVTASVTLSKEKFSPSSPDSDLYTSHDSDISENTPSTKITAKSDAFTIWPDPGLNECALKNKGNSINKIWEEFLEFKEDVGRQQQEIMGLIQIICEYFKTFRWGMKNGTTVREIVQEKNQKARRITALAEQQSLKLAGKEQAEVRSRATPTLSQKEEESKRSCTKCKRKHTQKGSFSQGERRKYETIAQRQRQRRELEQNLNYLLDTRRRADVNVNCEESHEHRSVACSNLRAGTRKIDVEHRKRPCKCNRCVAVRQEDRTGQVSSFYCRNTRGYAAVSNHHANNCRLLDEISYKKRKLRRQAKTLEDNVKRIFKRTLVWKEKKGTVMWKAKKRRPKANGAIQTQSTCTRW